MNRLLPVMTFVPPSMPAPERDSFAQTYATKQEHKVYFATRKLETMQNVHVNLVCIHIRVRPINPNSRRDEDVNWY